MNIPEKYYSNTARVVVVADKDSSVKDWVVGILSFCLGISLFWVIEKHCLFLSKYANILEGFNILEEVGMFSIVSLVEAISYFIAVGFGGKKRNLGRALFITNLFNAYVVLTYIIVRYISIWALVPLGSVGLIALLNSYSLSCKKHVRCFFMNLVLLLFLGGGAPILYYVLVRVNLL